jgi:hypothetical protein
MGDYFRLSGGESPRDGEADTRSGSTSDARVEKGLRGRDLETRWMPSGGSTGSEDIAPLSSRERLILAEWERARVKRVTRAKVAGRLASEKADKITSALLR